MVSFYNQVAKAEQCLPQVQLPHLWLCSETRRNPNSRAAAGRGSEGRQVL